MTTYEISTLLGTSSFGHYAGRTPADALCAMHVDAGYRVAVEDGELIWHDDADEVTCGGLDRWNVRPLRLLEVLRLADLPNYLRGRDDINAAITAAMPHIGITNRDWWAFPRSPMLLADWAADVSRAAALVTAAVTAAAVASELLSCDLDCLARSEHQRALRATLECAWPDEAIRSLAPVGTSIDDVRAAYTELARGTLAALDAADLDRECYWCEGDGSVGIHRCCVCHGSGVEL